jgi:uncharacterized protein (TIGR03435 family)
MRWFAVFLAASALSAQAPSFEVASVKPSGAMPGERKRMQLTRDPGRIHYTSVPFASLVEKAYDLKSYQVEGPDWIRRQMYDIDATFPASSSDQQVQAMLQALLKERFGLEVHREQKPLPVYELGAAKNGFQGKPADKAIDLRIGITGRGRSLTGAAGMPSLATWLTALLDRPVVDVTGVQGNYEIQLEWTPDEREANSLISMKVNMAKAQGLAVEDPDGSSGSLDKALRDKLGLKLDAKKNPVETLIIDKAERAPVEN